jgi:hypothetical protein
MSSLSLVEPQFSTISDLPAHDSQHLTINASWRGCDLLADLAYARLAQLRACNAHSGRFMVHVRDVLLEADTFVLDEQTIYAAVYVRGCKKVLVSPPISPL